MARRTRITTDEWRAALEQATADGTGPTHGDGMTAKEYAQAHDRSISWAQRHLSAAVASGQAKLVRGRRKGVDGRVQRVPVYHVDDMEQTQCPQDEDRQQG